MSVWKVSESQTWFVEQNCVVRQIWGTSDSILFIFAGAAAEFSLNKAVDWLFFTGRLPADPLGRLFSTVTYARQIVFSSMERANAVIDRLAAIHREVEETRRMTIPPWAYRDVLYMLIDYSIRAHELLVRRLEEDEKAEVYDVFLRVGLRMGIPSLPPDYNAWLPDREKHMAEDLDVSNFTHDLYKQYRIQLGLVRYRILLGAQAVITPAMEWFLKKAILPSRFVVEIRELDQSAKREWSHTHT